ncbi:hypothetical protein [Flavobacterium sp. UGB4466]|uniref:hypothetical protein n=1 Tax=Flavobacterium sp. UGB4466 TaxID=2730889 RepID=UPI00192B1094|nr:hypothetical protein [Flavobacterium sp. UGB4466]
MNWKELKDFCNNLPESELEKKVILWREDEAVVDIYAQGLEEDHYINVDDKDSGCFSVSEAKFLDKDIRIKKVYDRGHPILHENF